MRITAVKRVRGQQYRLTLDGDEERQILVDAATFDRTPFRVDSEVDSGQLQELLALSRKNRTHSRALYYLSGRDYAARELERKLTRTAERETAAEVVERLSEVGLINDREYACRLAVQLAEYRHYPKRRILQTLYEKGIGREDAAAAVEQLPGEDLEQALALIRKKYYNKLCDRAGRDKTAAALARYGFDYETVRRAVAAAAEKTDWPEE